MGVTWRGETMVVKVSGEVLSEPAHKTSLASKTSLRGSVRTTSTCSLAGRSPLCAPVCTIHPKQDSMVESCEGTNMI